ncbi:hypothetical protein PVAP13_4KG211200 [Panicum virgatum]|uniref:Uncharacterized protein n=1 Tax=Panicum virgatum TaxID=38727 RepID=A0A8T0TQV9_PANVG|nr:hypothetical protein PVAP13_4KG211200 [Panicum virgatum]
MKPISAAAPSNPSPQPPPRPCGRPITPEAPAAANPVSRDGASQRTARRRSQQSSTLQPPPCNHRPPPATLHLPVAIGIWCPAALQAPIRG